MTQHQVCSYSWVALRWPLDDLLLCHGHSFWQKDVNFEEHRRKPPLRLLTLFGWNSVQVSLSLLADLASLYVPVLAWWSEYEASHAVLVPNLSFIVYYSNYHSPGIFLFLHLREEGHLKRDVVMVVCLTVSILG